MHSICRLGKKKMESKEKEVKTVEGITRLICLSKGHNTPLKVHIDGSEWSGNESHFLVRTKSSGI